MSKITTFLSYGNNQAEEAARLYVSIFEDKGSRITNVTPGPDGKAMVVAFELFGQPYTALNVPATPDFAFTNGVSLMITCESQEEVDRYWERLAANGGKEVACGWVKDKFGLPWQVVPRAMMEMLSDKDKEKSGRAFQAMTKMVKLDIATLRKAFDGG